MSPKKGCMKMGGGEGGFLPWDSYKVCWNGHFYTTKGNCQIVWNLLFPGSP